MHMCWQYAQNTFRQNHRKLLIVVTLGRENEEVKENLHFSFCTFLYGLNFLATDSLSFIQFFNVNRRLNECCNYELYFVPILLSLCS